jgi:hypothetical protein
VNEIVPGLYRWTAPHPAWKPDPEPESPADWPEDVGGVLYLAPGAAVFIDPLVPDALWPALDERVTGRPVVVLTTLRFHGRSRDAVLERYGGALIRHDAPMPAGVEAMPVRGFDETMYWLPEPRALVPGDRLVGDGAGGARMCPESWVEYLAGDAGVGGLRAALRPLLDLPLEHLLLSHGEPVLGGARAALASALAERPGPSRAG